MFSKKKIGIVLIFLGVVFFAIGLNQYRKSCAPNTCIVSFSKSLGGKASMAFENSIQRVEYYGIAGMSMGVVFVLTGGVFLLKSRIKSV